MFDSNFDESDIFELREKILAHNTERLPALECRLYTQGHTALLLVTLYTEEHGD